MSTTTLRQIPTGTYTVDPVHSTFGFTVKHNGISLFRGQFEQVDASLRDGVLRGTVQVDSVKTPIADLKGHLLSPDFFDAERPPRSSSPPTRSASPMTAASRSTAS